ncbi:restriction endonuclease subunit S [Zhengella sp. ZM62]|uniref:restriction endonuclease subunit S n=1 Tax=Zhengella sedimenti TaxID=3390035 RepID=UPI00397672AE
MMWSSRTLGDLAEFTNGLNFSEKNDGDGLKIVRVRDFGDRHFVDWNSLSEIDPEGLKISDKVFLDPDDIVIVRSNGNKDLVGRSMIYSGPPKTAAFAGFCIRARVDKRKASPQFVHYWLRSPSTREKLSREGGGTGIQNVSQSLLRMQTIILPPLAEQRGIAAILGALDDKIELNRKTAATLEAMARALYRSWFVDFDPVHAKAEGRAPAHMDAATAALFPDRFGDNGLPEGWETLPLSSVCDQAKKTIKPMEAPSDVFQHFSLPAFDAFRMPLEEVGASIKSNKLFVPNNSILFSRLNPIIPRVWWARTTNLNAVPIASTEFFIAKARRETETTWLYCLLSSEEFRDDALARVTGTSNSHQRVPPKGLGDIEITNPSMEIVDVFSSLSRTWFERIHAMANENVTLAALRDTLLPRLMSGELRVGEACEQVEAIA